MTRRLVAAVGCLLLSACATSRPSQVDDELAAMTLEQKAGQLFMAWTLSSEGDTARRRALIRNVRDGLLGGVILSLGTTDQARELIARLQPIIFDPELDGKSVNLDEGVDLVADSANNYYEGVTQAQVEAYYAGVVDRDDPTPVVRLLNRAEAGLPIDPEEIYDVFLDVEGVIIGDVDVCRRKIARHCELPIDRLGCFTQFGDLGLQDDPHGL